MARENNYIGKQLGNYRILEELASGSFGRVYRGAHVFLTKRIVAIKLLHRINLGSQKERDSFLQEAQLLEMLKHRNYSGGLEWLVGPDKGDGSEPFPQKWRGLPKGTEQQTAALDALR